MASNNVAKSARGNPDAGSDLHWTERLGAVFDRYPPQPAGGDVYGDGDGPHDKLKSIVRKYLANTPDAVAPSDAAGRLCAQIVERVRVARDVHIHIHIHDRMAD